MTWLVKVLTHITIFPEYPYYDDIGDFVTTFAKQLATSQIIILGFQIHVQLVAGIRH